MTKKKSRARGKKKEAKAAKVKPQTEKSDPSVVVWDDDKEPDLIHGIYGSKNHNLGVSKIIYSGLPTLDRALSIKRGTDIYGYPLNKIFELFGAEQSGKTTLSLYLCQRFIACGGRAYFVDFEHKYDPAWNVKIAKANGLSEDALAAGFKYVDPQHFEQFICWLLRFMRKIIAIKNDAKVAILEAMKKKGDEETILRLQKVIDTPILVVVDSIASIYTKSEREGKDETAQRVAELANLFNRVLKHIRLYLGYTNCHILFLNQVRDKIDTNPFLSKFGSKIKTPGGNAVKHFSDARLHIARTGSTKRTRNKVEEVIASTHIVKVVKNQMGIPPFREAELTMMYGRGFMSFQSVLDVLAATGLVKIDGSKYKFKWKGEVVTLLESELDEVEDEHPEYVKSMHSLYRKGMNDV